MGIVYACIDCSAVNGCKVISKESNTPCMYCPVRNNCDIRKNTQKYTNTFKFERLGYCDECWEGQRRKR